MLVTGASGGVGSTAVDILASRGYEVVASSGKDPAFLKALGASEVISREDAIGDPDRPLGKTRWAGAVDCVGGDVLGGVLRTLRYGGGGGRVRQHRRREAPGDRAAVHPARRLAARRSTRSRRRSRRAARRGDGWPTTSGRRTSTTRYEISLDELDATLDAILRGELQGRTVVKL